MKKFLIAGALLIVAMGVFGCSSEKKEQQTPAVKQRSSGAVLRDPFRPDHPTRQEWEAEKEKRELEKKEQV